MKLENIAGFSNIDDFVKDKLERFRGMEKTFASLYELMFSERGNTLFEESTGYRVRKTTYGEAREQVELRAAALRGLLTDAPKNAVIGLYMENSLDWILNFWAILRAGFRPLLMNLRLATEALEEVLAQMQACAVISDGAEFSVRTVLAQELAAAEGGPAGEEFGTELFVMSSGTSAHLKVCAYGAEEIYHQIEDSFQIITQSSQMKKHYEGELKQLTFLPFYHIFGLAAVYIWFAFFSRSFVHLADMKPETIVNTIRRHKVTHIFAVPMFWNKVYEQALKTIHERGEKVEKKFRKGLAIAKKLSGSPALSRAFSRVAFREVRQNLFGESICFMITGGSEIREEVMEFFNAIGYLLTDGYGMTEIGITSVELSTVPAVRNSRSVGRPLSSIRYRVDETGELLVSGEAIAKYIIEDGVKKPRGDWFHTGDLAEMRDGRCYILGRRDDVVIGASGENLNPGMIEPSLDGIEGVRGVCLIGARSGEELCPTLIVSINPYLSKDSVLALRAQLRERLAERKLATQITKLVFTTTPLIRGQEFKLNRRVIAEDYAAGRLTVVEPESMTERRSSDDPLYAKVREIFAQVTERPAAEITDDFDFFTDGGGTSLDYFAMTSMLSDEFSVSLPTAEGRSLNTPAEIGRYLEEQMGR